MKKRWLYVILMIALLSALLAMPSFADDEGDLYYSEWQGEVSITGCKDSAVGVITIPDTIDGFPVTEIFYNAFSGTGVTGVVFPSGLKRIMSSAFDDSPIYEDASNWENGAFYVNNALVSVNKDVTELNVKEGTKWIAFNAARGCEQLKKVTLPNSVEYLNAYAFSDCTSLEEITIPSGVIDAGYGTFQGSSSLKQILVDKENTAYCSVDGVLFTADQTKLIAFPYAKADSYVIPAGVTSIGDMAFDSCKNLKRIVIPVGVTSIGRDAFSYCTSLNSIAIPEGVESIETETFFGCSGLKEISFPSTLKYIEEWAFFRCFPTDIYDAEGGYFSDYEPSESGPTWLMEATIHKGHQHDWSDRTVETPADSGHEGTCLVSCSVCGAAKRETIQPISTGWQKADGKWYYYNQDGTMRTSSWLRSNSKWYYLNADGTMRTGWLKSGGKWYYMDQNGAMVTGWKEINGKKYYMNASGVMQTGWVKVSEKWYYMDASGAMQTGWVKVSEKWYYMDRATGQMRHGWIKPDGNWYYLNDSGAMVKGWQQIKDKWYFFNGSGVMLTGTQVINGKTQLFDDNGVWLGRLDN